MKKNKINNFVTFKIIKLINSNSLYIGIFKLKDCLKKINKLNLDLVEIGTKNKFSICKLINYNKFEYLEYKKKKNILIKNKITNKNKKIKEIKFHLFIFKSDYLNKIRFIKNFLNKNIKVKITLIIKGREVLKIDLIKYYTDEIIKNISNFGVLVNKINSSNKLIFLYFDPKNVKNKK